MTNVSPSGRYIFVLLARAADPDGTNCFPRLESLSEQSGYARSTVIRSIEELERLDFLTRHVGGGRGKSNRYILHFGHFTPTQDRDGKWTIPQQAEMFPPDVARAFKASAESAHSVAPRDSKPPPEASETVASRDRMPQPKPDTVASRDRMPPLNCSIEAPKQCHHDTRLREDSEGSKKVRVGAKTENNLVLLLTAPGAPQRASPTQRERGCRLPDDWVAPPAYHQLAARLGLDPAVVELEFRNYWTGLPGAKALKLGELGWYRTWENRCKELAGRKQGRSHAAAAKPTVEQEIAARNARIRDMVERASERHDDPATAMGGIR